MKLMPLRRIRQLQMSTDIQSGKEDNHRYDTAEMSLPVWELKSTKVPAKYQII